MHAPPPRRARTALCVALGFAFAFAISCDSTTTSDKNTNWLRACDGAADCGPGLQCLAGSCSVPCGRDAECRRFGQKAVCALPSELDACSPSMAFCTVSCGTTPDCVQANDLQCVRSACLRTRCPTDGGRTDPRDAAEVAPDASRPGPDAAATNPTDATGAIPDGAGGNPGDARPAPSEPDGTGDPPEPAPGTITQLAPLPRPVRRIAAGSGNRVYVAYDGVSVVEDGGLQPYLSEAEIGAALGGAAAPAFDLRVGPDGVLYVLSTGLLRSTAAHRASALVQQQVETTFAVLGPDDFVFAGGAAGLSRVIAGQREVVYAVPPLPASGCTQSDLSVQASGPILVIHGCIGAPILDGTLQGRPLRHPFGNPETIRGQRIIQTLCTAPAPDGGFYVLVSMDQGRLFEGPHLFHVGTEADAGVALEEVETTPRFTDMLTLYGEVFTVCSMATSPQGHLFVAAASSVWKVVPQ